MTADSTTWQERFEVRPVGPDKVLPLGEAVRRAVRPGMTLHLAYTHNRPSAAIAELVRQYAGRDPRFTIVHLFTTGPAVALVTQGLAKRLVTTLICDPYPSPAPSRPIQRALARGTVAVEHWSVLSLIARLHAAAMGLPWMPVQGLAGSTLALENREHLIGGPDCPLSVRALEPDLSFVHAPAADRLGNVLLAPPYGEGIWGAMAAKEGVVVTVERLLEPAELRRHAHLTGIPASHVRSISVVPFGAHPSGLASAGIAGVEPYGDDAESFIDARRAGATEEGHHRWVEDWLTGPRDHDEYLARLGAERMLRLAGKARPDSYRGELLSALSTCRLDGPASGIEAMTVAAARHLAAKVRSAGHRAILSGLGAGNLAAWLAHACLEETGVPVALVAEIGLYGYTPRPCDPYLFNFRNLATCTLQTDSATALGLFVGGSRAMAIGALGAAEVDARGNLNSTRLEDGTPLVGSGGANDVASGAAEVVVAIPAGPRRLVEEVAYVTGPGDRVTAVVTELGVFEKGRGPERLRLTRLVPPLVNDDPAAQVRELAARSGFRFEVAPDLTIEAPALPDELARLRLYDPERAFLGPAGERA